MMMKMLMLGVGVAVIAGCATAQTTAQADGGVYRGEVWTWDERDSTVTLRQGTEKVRVKVDPRDLRGLRLHETVTLRGELAPPAALPHQVLPAPPMTAVPRGPAQQTEVNGTVASLDRSGLASIDSDRGRLVVWTASGDAGRFAAGAPVRVRISVQPVEMVPLADPRANQGASSAVNPLQPSALVGGEPGDWAVVTGRVLRLEPVGIMTVESPRGPIIVAVPDGTRYQEGGTVQVRTLVTAGS